jgi:hypothetical protein
VEARGSRSRIDDMPAVCDNGLRISATTPANKPVPSHILLISPPAECGLWAERAVRIGTTKAG